jgi:hypothetical protein
MNPATIGEAKLIIKRLLRMIAGYRARNAKLARELAAYKAMYE